MKLITKILAAIILISSQACTYEYITPEKVTEPETVSWSVDVLPILEKNCSVTGCHVAGAVSPDLSASSAYISLTFFGYVNTNQPEESTLYQKLKSGSMKGFASEQEKAIILKWIKLGALED